MKFVFILGLLLVVSIVGVERVDGATNPCGKTTPDGEAMKLAPCAEAAQDEKAAVSNSCCLQVKRIGQNPTLFCFLALPRAPASNLRSPLPFPSAATSLIVQLVSNVDVSILQFSC